MLEHGQGFYSRLVYSLECRRLGFSFLSPDINSPYDRIYPEPAGIRVPVKLIKGMTEATFQRFSMERQLSRFEGIEDFFRRVTPNQDEMQNLLRAGAFDSLDTSRTSQFWAWRRCVRVHGELDPDQQIFCLDASEAAPECRTEPTYLDRLKAETELLGFPVAGHPLDLHPNIAWKAYCPISDVQQFPHKSVTVAGLIIEERLHHQSGIVEVEFFADAYSQFGVNTIRYPVVEVEGLVLPFESGRGCTLQGRAISGARNLAAI